MIHLLRIVTMASLSAFLCASASAEWDEWTVRVSGPDVFGNNKVLAFVPGERGSALVVQCNSKDELALAYVNQATETEMNLLSRPGAATPAKFLVKVDDRKVITLDGELRPWNNDHLAVAADTRGPAVVAAIQAIGAAADTIDVGVEIGDHQQSEEFSAVGSAQAINTVIKDCKLADVKGNTPATSD